MNLDRLTEQLKAHEGFREKPYQDSLGVWTFGHGLTWISEAESEMVVRMRLSEISEALNPRIAALSERRQEVLINMAYNIGLAGLNKFRKMWLAIERGDYDDAATEMLDSRWAEQVKGRANELADIMRMG